MESPNPEFQLKQRHGCVTVWLILMIVLNAIAAVYSILAGGMQYILIPLWVLPILALISLLNIFFAVMLLRWKRWAFIGLLATTIVTFGINLMFTDVLSAVLGLFGILILFAVMQIRQGSKSTWENLE